MQPCILVPEKTALEPFASSTQSLTRWTTFTCCLVSSTMTTRWSPTLPRKVACFEGIFPLYTWELFNHFSVNVDLSVTIIGNPLLPSFARVSCSSQLFMWQQFLTIGLDLLWTLEKARAQHAIRLSNAPLKENGSKKNVD